MNGLLGLLVPLDNSAVTMFNYNIARRSPIMVCECSRTTVTYFHVGWEKYQFVRIRWHIRMPYGGRLLIKVLNSWSLIKFSF